MIIKKNLTFLDEEINKLQRVPDKLFQDAENWSKDAKRKLDSFEQNLENPRFINYDLLESKDPAAGSDIINFGETLVLELEEHKDISMERVASQIKQLSINFNKEIFEKMKLVVTC